jgi:peptidyl-prolyl cis-trans isomerase C
MNTELTNGCGSDTCACAGPSRASAKPVPTLASINGVALQEPGEALGAQTLRERAYTELLRWQAVESGLLPSTTDLSYREPDDAQRAIMESMVDQAVALPDPGEDECRRHYDAQKSRLIVGQALHVRHILFAVTPGVNVHALSQRAEAALLDLSRKGMATERFGQLAAELSNCPSSAQGGDLGWLTPEDCAPELAKELFFQGDAVRSLGLHPRLVHTRFGLHIVEVLARRAGTLPPFEQVRNQITMRLRLQSRSTAMRQYMQLLVGQARVEGLELEGSDTPLVQ